MKSSKVANMTNAEIDNLLSEEKRKINELSEQIHRNSGGIGVPGLLGIVFIVLKLCGVISWSWWWVLAPFWIPFVLFFGLLIIILVLYALACHTGKKIKEENNFRKA